MLVSYFLCSCIPADVQETYTTCLLHTNTADVVEAAAIAAPQFGHYPKWGETPEELLGSINFEKPKDPVENLTPVFKNNFDKLYAAVDKVTGEFKECKDMHECNETVHWNFELTGTKMEPMIFEGKTSLIDFTNKIKESKAASGPGVSYQP